MNIYKCEICDKIYNDKSKYTRHINRQIPCCPIFKDYENQKKKFYLETEHIQSNDCNVDNLNNQELDDNMPNNQSLENTDEDEDPTKIDKVKVLSDLIDYLYNNREAIIKGYKEKNKDEEKEKDKDEEINKEIKI
jgi:hypothetical protein